MVRLLHDTAKRLEFVIAAWECAQICRAADAAHFFVRKAVVDFTDAGDDQRTRAHGAGLLGDVECAFVESPVAECVGSLGDCNYFGVCGWIVCRARLIMCARNDLALMFDDCSDRHFVLFPSFDCLVVGMRHEILRISVELRWINLFKWTVEYLSHVISCLLERSGERALDIRCQSDSLAAFQSYMAKAQSEEYVEVEGKIVAVLPGTMFRVELANGHRVLAHISGKLRKHFIKITTGDTVKMEMSPYDLDKARIVYRLRNAAVQRNAPKRSYGPRKR